MIDNLLNEVWMPIAGYEGLYEISNYSRIKSTKFALHRLVRPKFEPTPKRRYNRCRLFNEAGDMEYVAHHRVSAMHYVPNKKPLLYTDVNHKDGDLSNNHVSNFEWTTHRENTLHGRLATKATKSSRFKGVSLHNIKAGGTTYRWAAYINKKHHRGFGFKTEVDAFNALKQFYKDNGINPKYLE